MCVRKKMKNKNKKKRRRIFIFNTKCICGNNCTIFVHIYDYYT